MIITRHFMPIRKHAKLYLDGTMQIWVDAEDSIEL